MERRVEELEKEKSAQLKEWIAEKKLLTEAMGAVREELSWEKSRLERELENEQAERARVYEEARKELEETETKLKDQVSRGVELVRVSNVASQMCVAVCRFEGGSKA